MAELNPTLDDGYRVEPFGEQEEVGEQAVIDLWAREGVVAGPEAKRRVEEVVLVGIHENDGLVGISSAYLRHSTQLKMDLWYYRAFVSKAHRRSNVAVLLALMGRDLLEQRYVSGEDARASGLVYEVENEGLKRRFSEAVWFPTLVTFIGENERGDHVRVRYFPGAMAPGVPE